jgi:protein-tyrosine-phosphatase
MTTDGDDPRGVDDGVGETPAWMAEAAALRAAAPRGLLFLCVANSARSQMAEGIARALAPPGVEVWSAGSEPTRVRPEAVAALAEIGIDLVGHTSKGFTAVPAERVDAVITLCTEEVCPAWLGHPRRLHWGLPDPAGVGGDEAARLAAFRATRDELRRRLGALLAPQEV